MLFGTTLEAMVKVDLETGSVPSLFGEPGIGKSSFFKALAASMGTKSFTLACNTLSDKADLTAPRLVPTPDGKSYSQEFYPHMEIQEAILYALAHPRERPILVLDEVNRANSDITSAALTLPTERKIGRELLPENLTLAVAGNDRGNVVALDEASLSRFAIYHVEPDAIVFLELMGDKLNHHIRSVLTQHPEYIFMRNQVEGVFQDGDDDDDDDGSMVATKIDLFESGEEMAQITTPRTIEYLSNGLNTIGDAELYTWIGMQSRFTMPNGQERTLSILEEYVEAKVGRTPFAAAIVNSIIQGSMSQNTSGGTATRLAAPKPSFYDDLSTLNTQQELDDYVTKLSDRELSQALVYALFEKKDNARVITSLTTAFSPRPDGTQPAIDQESSGTLINLGQSRLLDEDNIRAMFAVQNPFANNFENMFNMIGII